MELLSCIHASPVIRVYGPLLCVLICALFYVQALSVSQSTIVNHTATHSAHSRLHIVTHRRTRPNSSSHCPSRMPCRIPNTIGTSQVFHVHRLTSIFNYLAVARGAAPLVFPQRPRFRVFFTSTYSTCIHASSISRIFPYIQTADLPQIDGARQLDPAPSRLRPFRCVLQQRLRRSTLFPFI